MQQGKVDFIEWLSTQDGRELSGIDTIDSLIKDDVGLIAPLIFKLQTMDCVSIILNKYYNVSQSVIAEQFNVSQFAISKRISVAYDKLKIKLKQHLVEPNIEQARLDLSLLFCDEYLAEVMCMYEYHSSSFASVLFGKSSGCRKSQIMFYSNIINNACKTPIECALLGHNATKDDAQIYNEICKNKNEIVAISQKYNGLIDFILQNETFGDFKHKKDNNDG